MFINRLCLSEDNIKPKFWQNAEFVFELPCCVKMKSGASFVLLAFTTLLNLVTHMLCLE